MSSPRLIPSIEQLRQRAVIRVLERDFGHDAVVEGLRDETALLRAELRRPRGLEPGDAGDARHGDATDVSAYLEARLAARLDRTLGFSLCPVINATGVIIHTNLGRAPLATSAIDHVAATAGYTNLEYDLGVGTRGSRAGHAESLLRRLSGADAAAVVNNNAAATVLILTALAAGREVVISRGELVEIGGGFRVPDIMAQSGAVLREVGTTNRTRAADYAAAIGPRTALILRVHPSNFRIQGFVARPTLEDLVHLGRQLNVPVAEDLGSGSLLDVQRLAVRDGKPSPALDEPTVPSSVRAGADIVCFSGDKLLGGPQAGIIVGRHEALERLRTHPLMRALRVDKLTYAALEATLLEYARGRATETVPVARMIATPAVAVERRARGLAERLTTCPALRTELVDGVSTIGGGCAPGAAIPTTLLAVSVVGESAAALEAQLRSLRPPVVARIHDDQVVLDLRTVLPEQDSTLASLLLDRFSGGRD